MVIKKELWEELKRKRCAGETDIKIKNSKIVKVLPFWEQQMNDMIDRLKIIYLIPIVVAFVFHRKNLGVHRTWQL